MRSSRIDRRGTRHTPVARALVFASVALSLAWPAAFVAAAGASEPAKEPPAVSTGPSRVSGATVALTGTVNPRRESATYYFQYGPTNAYGSQTPSTNLAAGAAKVRVSQTVTGLQDGYHYRLVATNGGGTGYGLDRTYRVRTTKQTKTTKKTKTGLTFTVSRPPAEGQVVGSPVTIEGTLSGPGAGRHLIVLQSSSYPSGGVYTNTGTPQMTATTGRFSFFIAHLLRSTRFRVAAVGPQPTYSLPITELATVRVTLHVRSAPRSGLVRLYGTVSPAVTGATVYFQLQEASKPPKTRIFKSEKAEERAEEKAELPRFATQFTAPVKRATRSLSRFSMVTSIRKGGLYRAYVQLPKGPLASGSSQGVSLNTTAKARKVKRAS